MGNAQSANGDTCKKGVSYKAGAVQSCVFCRIARQREDDPVRGCAGAVDSGQ